MNKDKKAFTLIELLVVIAIIGLLSTLSIIALNSARAKARDAKRVSDVKQIQVALEMYYNEMADYPTSIAGGVSATGGTFLRVTPTPPTPIDGPACNVVADATYSTTEYKYVRTGTAGNVPSYTIGFCVGSDIGQGTTRITGNKILIMTPSGVYER